MPPVSLYSGSGHRLGWAPLPPGAGARIDIIPGSQPAITTTSEPTTSWDSYDTGTARWIYSRSAFILNLSVPIIFRWH